MKFQRLLPCHIEREGDRDRKDGAFDDMRKAPRFFFFFFPVLIPSITKRSPDSATFSFLLVAAQDILHALVHMANLTVMSWYLKYNSATDGQIC